MMTKKQEDEILALYEHSILNALVVHEEQEFRQIFKTFSSVNSKQWLLHYRIMCCRAGLCSDNKQQLYEEAIAHLQQLKHSPETLRATGALYFYYAQDLLDENLEESIHFAEKSYFAFEKNHHEIGKWRAFYSKATALFYLQDYDQALPMCLTAFEAVKDIDLQLSVEILIRIALIYDITQQMPDALLTYQKAENICLTLMEYNKYPEKIESCGRSVIFRNSDVREKFYLHRLIILIKGGFHSVLMSTGAFSDALRYAEELIELLKHDKDNTLRVRWLVNLAGSRLKLGHVDEAKKILQSAREISDKNNMELQGYISWNMAQCHFQEKQYDEAILFFDDALKCLMKYPLTETIAFTNIYTDKAELYNETGRYGLTLQLLKKVIEEQPQYSSPNLIMEYVVALAHSDSNSQEQCYDYINQINTLLQESISPSDIALIQKKKSTVFALFGDTEKAYSCLVEYQEYYEKMMTNQANQKSDIIAALYAIEAERYKNIILEQQLILKNEQIHKLQNDLRMKAHALLQQVQAVNVLRSDIITVFDELDKAEDILKNIRKKLNESPLLQRNWEKFLQAFEEISPNFSQRLLERYPDITKTEVRVLILVLSGLNNQEVSELLSVTERSVEKHRLNIRKKTGLKRDQSLHAAMMEIM
ncbi:MAG TPA: LuxR C-terminal-related transcriptional regulator [Candidatus Kapabacteria bacterium]|jgi:tetratricopeptide (TPR) repeat protein/DNA-binding CsgD family transcriptional regulator|nr:hypothetical protein [Ignavibacteria bacterium]HRK59625.1 LuxR C-terminal-related transcriptional regulator [Candidatus Kapabacteria bacterium]